MVKKEKIYTKGGDKGKTSLVGGTRVDKYHDRLEAYGTLDELNSYLGLLYDYAANMNDQQNLHQIQCDVFVISSFLAAESEQVEALLPPIREDAIRFLEEQIDLMSEEIPPLDHFVLPGGSPFISFCNIARTVCRRAERRVVKLSVKEMVQPFVMIYLNRLSDYLFLLGRYAAKQKNITERFWIHE